MEGVQNEHGSVSTRVLRDTRVVFASICCLKRLLNTLGVAEGGADFVISKFSLDEVLRKPTALLDALVLYLFIVHNIDWYSSTWERTTILATSKEQSEGEVKVFDESCIDHDEQVSRVIENLRRRTENFLQKVQQQKFIRRTQTL